MAAFFPTGSYPTAAPDALVVAGGGGGFSPAWVRNRSQVIGAGSFLMYPRNAASPPRIAIGAVIQISDGAVQSSGVSVVVRPEGGSETASGGTVSYGASSNVVYYAPTQAETDYTAFVVTAYKTGCLPISQTIITTASATTGTVLLAPTTHTSAVVPTVSTLTGHTPQTGDAFARLGAPAGASMSADVAAVKAQTAAIEVDTQDIQSRLPATLVSGRMDASTGAIQTGVDFSATMKASINTEVDTGISDAALATAAALATVDTNVDAILVDTAEIGAAGAGLTALASAANLATVAGYLDTGIAAILADTNELQSDWANGGRLDNILDGRASQTSVDGLNNLSSAQAQSAAAAALVAYDPPTKAELDSAVSGLATAANLATVDTVVDGIKAKTDSLTFTQAGHVDANVQRINDVTIIGDGSGTPFQV
jgi:hypothetical protein